MQGVPGPLVIRSRSDGRQEIIVLEPDCPPLVLVCHPGCPAAHPPALPLDPALRAAVVAVLVAHGWAVAETWIEMDAGATYTPREG